MAPLFCVIMNREKERNDIFMVVGSVHAGHGGAKVNGRWTDSGAVGSGYQEANVARTITDKMNKIMKVRNVTDNTSRTSNDIIRGQAKGINASPNGYQISNHLNAFNGKATGVEVLYGSDSEKPMAAKLSAAIAKILGLPDRGAKDGKWLGIATMTGAGKKALLIEWGFIDNAGDMKKLMANMDKAIAEVCNILGYKASTPTQPSTPSNGTQSHKKGDTVTVLKTATHYQTGQPIAAWVKGQKFRVKDIKVVKQSRSKKAYLLEGINSWLLEQDLK